MEQLRFLSWAALKIILNLQGRGEKGIGLNGDRDMPQTTQLKITWKMGMGNANRKKKKKSYQQTPDTKSQKKTRLDQSHAQIVEQKSSSQQRSE